MIKFYSEKEAGKEIDFVEFEDIKEGLKWLQSRYRILTESRAGIVCSVAVTNENECC